MILNPGCTLELPMAVFKKFKYTDIPSPNFDFIGLTEVITKYHIFKTFQALMMSDLAVYLPSLVPNLEIA